MRKYIREILRELMGKKDAGYVPPMPTDLNNQELSKNPLQKTRQLDYQAQKNEERETS